MHWASVLQWMPDSGYVTYAEVAVDFESHSNLALPARPGHRHAWQVPVPWEWACVLREAVDLLQPLHTCSTLLEGGFRWICASLVPLGGFRGMGRTERPVFVCRLTCSSTYNNLWMHRQASLWASPRDYFPAGYLPRRPGTGSPSASV